MVKDEERNIRRLLGTVKGNEIDYIDLWRG